MNDYILEIPLFVYGEIDCNCIVTTMKEAITRFPDDAAAIKSYIQSHGWKYVQVHKIESKKEVEQMKENYI